LSGRMAEMFTTLGTTASAMSGSVRPPSVLAKAGEAANRTRARDAWSSGAGRAQVATDASAAPAAIRPRSLQRVRQRVCIQRPPRTHGEADRVPARRAARTRQDAPAWRMRTAARPQTSTSGHLQLASDLL